MGKMILQNPKVVPLFEEHGEVLAHWSTYKWKSTTLIYFDRHLDLKSLSKPAIRTIRNAPTESALKALNRKFPFEDAAGANYGLDNFLYAAIKLGWLGRLIWVFPLTPRESIKTTAQRLSSILINSLSLLGNHGAEIMNTCRLTEAGPTVNVNGAILYLTTVELLPQLALDPDTPIDIDLDFFGDEKGALLFDPITAARCLKKIGLTNIISMTASISSGFMAPSLRWISDAFATELGYRAVSASDRRNPASYIMRLLAYDGRISASSMARLHGVLPQLGGGGWSLLSVIAGLDGNYSTAETAFFRARENGDGAHWPAYMIGLTQLKLGNPDLALQWFKIAQGNLVDSIQLHSISLEALCQARLSKFHNALYTAELSIELTPLRREPYLVGIFSARQEGIHWKAEEINNKLMLLDELLSKITGKNESHAWTK